MPPDAGAHAVDNEAAATQAAASSTVVEGPRSRRRAGGGGLKKKNDNLEDSGDSEMYEVNDKVLCLYITGKL